MKPQTVCKIVTGAELEEAICIGHWGGSKLDKADGFLHFSTPEQVAGTLSAHYGGAEGLWLIHVDAAVLGDDLRWEKSRDGALFPHLYAKLSIRIVDRVEPIAAPQ